ncbi:MAG: LrgB family protein [Lachnospiraceae bacterium]|jgi:predicted murein hydrolase (TIGR00659 family)|nr:LrgB family protein [Lachnospiraceae bacterium]MCH4030042.1 LrgB family protein [Lachnospiraceae bacterium]MCH4070298.1 LrgB family protein [Lachnospiraceae bacterium]MCH4107810.1 LrgB family protein [Lachnospiraceae bacterium]MCI1361493.1 LrgB family protein [Lachnospiraceae bacterium]
MNDLILNSTTAGVAISLLAYGAGIFLRRKTKSDICNPLLISIVIVIVFLLIFRVDYDSYNKSAQYLSYLLTPATVSLAIPLYRQMDMLKKNLGAILLAVLAGVIASMGSILVLSVAFGLTHPQYVTLLPKSITTAIGMGISEELGGNVTISVAVIIVTGVFGNMIIEPICRLFRIKNPISKGLAAGTASHAIGTAKAMEMGEIEGSMSSLAIVVSGLITVVCASIFARMY